MHTSIVIGVDVGGTKIAAGAVTSAGRVLARSKIQTPAESDRAAVVAAVAEMVAAVVKAAGCGRTNVNAVGIGVPGIIDHATGVILATPNMDMAGAAFLREIKKKLRSPVVLGNDVNLGVLGEQWKGAAQGKEHVVGLFAGTGLGAGVIVDGKLLTGAHGAAAEIGHMFVERNGPKCTCGNKGCLEALVGKWAIGRDICKALKKGKKTKVGKLQRACRSGRLKSKLLAKALKKNDRVVTRVMRGVSENLGEACISLRHIFDPEIIVLGGGVIEACGGFMLPIIKETFQSDRFFKKIKPCPIVKSRLGDDAVIVGAAALALRSLPGHLA